MTKAPALFIGHGSPMNAIEDTPSPRAWAALAQRFPKPRAIVVVSAHWVTDGVRVTTNARPRTIHDFGRGFPQALFDVQYPAPGDPELARDIINRLAAFGARGSEEWGLDHGTWSVLIHMYPNADIPVVQVSLDARRKPEDHYAIGKALAVLRDNNVLVLSSGNIVHNLRAFFGGNGDVEPWVSRFNDAVAGAVWDDAHTSLMHYQEWPGADQAAPDWDHFVPLFYTLGAQHPGEHADVFNRQFMSGISMTSIAYGLPQ